MEGGTERREQWVRVHVRQAQEMRGRRRGWELPKHHGVGQDGEVHTAQEAWY